jgi:hypothetical protein
VTMLVYCTPLMGGWSISQASWDVDAVHGVHAMYSVSRLGTACGQPDTTGFFRTQLPSPGLQTVSTTAVSTTAVKTGGAAGHQVCVFHHRRQDGQCERPSGVRFPSPPSRHRRPPISRDCCPDETRYAQARKQPERCQQILAAPHYRALDQETQDASRPMPHRGRCATPDGGTMTNDISVVDTDAVVEAMPSRRDQRGMVSAEWAVGIIAAVAIAGVLLGIVTSGPVHDALLDFILMVIRSFSNSIQ